MRAPPLLRSSGTQPFLFLGLSQLTSVLAHAAWGVRRCIGCLGWSARRVHFGSLPRAARARLRRTIAPVEAGAAALVPGAKPARAAEAGLRETPARTRAAIAVQTSVLRTARSVATRVCEMAAQMRPATAVAAVAQSPAAADQAGSSATTSRPEVCRSGPVTLKEAMGAPLESRAPFMQVQGRSGA